MFNPTIFLESPENRRWNGMNNSCVSNNKDVQGQRTFRTSRLTLNCIFKDNIPIHPSIEVFQLQGLPYAKITIHLKTKYEILFNFEYFINEQKLLFDSGFLTEDKQLSETISFKGCWRNCHPQGIGDLKILLDKDTTVTVHHIYIRTIFATPIGMAFSCQLPLVHINPLQQENVSSLFITKSRSELFQAPQYLKDFLGRLTQEAASKMDSEMSALPRIQEEKTSKIDNENPLYFLNSDEDDPKEDDFYYSM